VMEFERQELAMETLGMSLLEGKALLQGVQEFVSDQQAMEFLKRSQPCPHCGRQRSVKANGSIHVHTVYGTVHLSNPRWRHCDCQPLETKSFHPLQSWLRGQTSPVAGGSAPHTGYSQRRDDPQSFAGNGGADGS